MWSQARNNRKVVRPTPAVLNTNYVITWNIIAMTTIDVNLSAEQVCSTERARRRSRNSKNALRGTYVAVQILWHIPFWLFPGDQFTCYSVLTTSKKRPLILNSIMFFPYSAGSLSIFYYFSLFLDFSTYDYNMCSEYDEKKENSFMQRGRMAIINECSSYQRPNRQ